MLLQVTQKCIHIQPIMHKPAMAAALCINSPMFQQVYLLLFIYLHTLLVLYLCVFTREKNLVALIQVLTSFSIILPT